MPIPQGFYTGRGQMVAAGLAGGLGEGIETGTNEWLKQQREQRVQAASILKDLTDKVMSRAIDPDQAANAAALGGIPVPKGYFHALAPSDASRLQGIVKDTTAETSPEEFNLRLRAADLPEMSNAFTTPPQFRMPGGSDDASNPAAARVFAARQEAATRAVKPEITGQGMTGEGENAQPTHTYQQFSPITGTFTNPSTFASGPTAGQKGTYEGTVAAQTERLKRPEEVLTTTAQTKARMEQEYSPEMIALRAKQSGAERAAQLAAEAAGVRWEAGARETDTGLKYLDLDQFQGNDQRFAAQAALKNGIGVVRGPEKQLLEQTDSVRSQLMDVANLTAKLPTTFLGIPWAEAIKKSYADPQLAGQLDAMMPAALGTARVMAGTTGFRSNRIEMERAIAAYLTVTTAEGKAVQLATINKILANEQAQHVLPKAADRAAFMQAQITPTPPPPNVSAARSYRVGNRTLYFDARGNYLGSTTTQGTTQQ